MSPQGRPKGESPSAQREGSPMSPPGRPKGESTGAAREGSSSRLLEVADVVKTFGGVRAVDHVSFSLEAGRMTALIGPNGAGKTTLFGVIAGQHAADDGTVRFEGRDLARVPVARRAALGIARTFQTAQAFATLAVRENVQLALAAHAGRALDPWRPLPSFDGAPADALLARVGLAEQARRAAADLPYADLKRLELAIALAGAPRLLLMDEPTAGMAAAERFALMDLVRGQVEQLGLTVLFTEHSMDVVFGYAQRLLVLSRGRLIADGTPDEVRADPAAQAAYFGADAAAAP
ncbi:MAG: ABC transporter ATP-binding protein [Betaproteobacteria bacterium]